MHEFFNDPAGVISITAHIATNYVILKLSQLMKFTAKYENIRRSFNKFGKFMYTCTLHPNTIYPLFLSKTKPKLIIVHGHRSRSLLRRRLSGFYSRPPTFALRSMKFPS